MEQKANKLKLKVGPFELGLCRYEKCLYYMNCPHPKTGLHCAFGHPACRLGKFDMFITMQLASFSLSIIRSYKSLQCTLWGHQPYIVPAPERVKKKILACRRCGKRLKS